MKFWLTLILGTITISAGLTYLKLHRGAQTIVYPPPAPKAKLPLIEFLPSKPNTDETSMEVSANLVMINVKESVADVEKEVGFKIKNKGEGTLELSYKSESCSCATVYVDNQRVSGTSHMTKVAPGQTVDVKMTYKAKYENTGRGSDKKRIRVTFEHNDERYSDNLQFEIVTVVKPA